MALGSSYLWRQGGFSVSIRGPVPSLILFEGPSLPPIFRNDRRLAGSVGCNRYTTTYEARGSSLTVNPQIAATRMWCGDPEGAMAQEDAFLQAWAASPRTAFTGTVSSWRMPKRLPSSPLPSPKPRNGPRIEPAKR